MNISLPKTDLRFQNKFKVSYSRADTHHRDTTRGLPSDQRLCKAVSNVDSCIDAIDDRPIGKDGFEQSDVVSQ